MRIRCSWWLGIWFAIGFAGWLMADEYEGREWSRPQYHLTLPGPPLALVDYEGEYQLFYGCPSSSGGPSGPMGWGRASSRDLVHWQDHGMVLSPRPNEIDEDGCLGGSAIVLDGSIRLFYVARSGEGDVIAMAVSTSVEPFHFRSFKDPVVAAAPARFEGLHAPLVRYERINRYGDKALQLLVGSRFKNGRANLLRYSTLDGSTWKYHGTIFAGATGENDWRRAILLARNVQHPSLVGEWQPKHILAVEPSPAGESAGENAAGDFQRDWWFGAWSGHRFTPKTVRGRGSQSGLFEPFGMCSHHVACHIRGHEWLGMVACDGGTRDSQDGSSKASAWPRANRLWELGLPQSWKVIAETSSFQRTFHPAIESLRVPGKVREWSGIGISPGAAFRVPDAGQQVEIHAKINIADASEVLVSVLESSNKESSNKVSGTVFAYRPQGYEMSVEEVRDLPPGMSGLGRRVHRLEAGDPTGIELRILLDHSLVECAINGRERLATRAILGKRDSGLSVTVRGGAATIESLKIWPVRALKLTENDEASRKK